MPARPQFVRNIERQEPRVLICSICAQCGARQIASAADGSLQEWEDRHECRKPVQRSETGDSAPRKISSMHGKS